MRGVLALLLLVSVVACKQDGKATKAAGGSDTKGTAGEANGSVAAADQLTDANIFYLIDAAHVADSSTGALAATKGTNSEIRAFGKMMMRDHHTLRLQAQQLSEKLKFLPLPPASDSSAALLQRTMSILNGAARGRDFDKAYVDNEIVAHMQVLEMLTGAMRSAQDPQLKYHIQRAAPVVLSHLDKVKEIQKLLEQ